MEGRNKPGDAFRERGSGMNSVQYEKDLIVLAADKNMEFAIKGLLERYQSLHIRKLVSDIRVHPERDPGCRIRGHEFLRPFSSRYDHALVIFDREGCGREQNSREEIESEIEQHLSGSGWCGRAAAIVIDPELENWVWSVSACVDDCLGWFGNEPDLRTWLKEKGFLEEGQIKPRRPKEAVEAALRVVSKPRSSAIYYKLAKQTPFENCKDSAFNKLKTRLREWFSSL